MPHSRLLLLSLAAVLCPAVVFAQETKPQPNNEKQTFRPETDSGRYRVGSEKFDPKQLGVAIYPGAKVDRGENDGKGANLSLDWGDDSVHLYVQKYITPDSADKVLAFYRKQLAKFGAVLECRDGKPVDASSSELKCDGDDDAKNEKEHKGTELKAGTKSKQHVVGVTPKDGGTDFQVVYVEQIKHGEI